MTTLPEDIIIDLLPLYFAGEASAATRELIDAYFLLHPAFASTVRASANGGDGVPAPAPDNVSRMALKRLKTTLRWRGVFIAVGIFFTLLPMTFVYHHDKLDYMMLRDNPVQASIFVCIAVVNWIAFWLMERRLSTPQAALKDYK